MTTPKEVRSELKRRGMPYGIAKAGGAWYVHGGDASSWHSASLNTYRLDGMTAAEWADQIRDMEISHKKEE